MGCNPFVVFFDSLGFFQKGKPGFWREAGFVGEGFFWVTGLMPNTAREGERF